MKNLAKILLLLGAILLFPLHPFFALVKGEEDASKNHPKKVKN